MQYVIGLTGLIGSGKSLAGTLFQNLGVDVIDTDAIAHSITSVNGCAIQAIISEFGKEFVNASGELNRAKMRELVFSKPQQRYRLEGILHPLIYSETLRQIAISTKSYVIVMVPLLFKSIKFINLIHRSIFIDCDEPLLIKRVISRSKMSEAEVRTVLKAQMPRRMQLILCDDVLYNNGSISQLNCQIIKLNTIYKNLFAPLKN